MNALFPPGYGQKLSGHCSMSYISMLASSLGAERYLQGKSLIYPWQPSLMQRFLAARVRCPQCDGSVPVLWTQEIFYRHDVWKLCLMTTQPCAVMDIFGQPSRRNAPICKTAALQHQSHFHRHHHDILCDADCYLRSYSTKLNQ